MNHHKTLFEQTHINIVQDPAHNTATLGDCMDLLRALESHSVDLIATDPPYEINFEHNDWDAHNTLHWSVLSKEFYRILKPTGNLVMFQGWSNVLTTRNEVENTLH